MSLKDGKVKIGTVLYKKVNLTTTPIKSRDFDVYLSDDEMLSIKHLGYVRYNRRYNSIINGEGIVTLVTLEEGLIPNPSRYAKYPSVTSRKLRVPKAYVSNIEVLRIYNGHFSWEDARSSHEASFTYKIGDIVTPKYPFNPDKHNVCASGIHAFRTRAEAEAYNV